MTSTTAHGGESTDRVPKKAAIASFVGSMLEYYDFFIYGSAAGLVFPTVFFADSDPATATLLSLATFGVAYVARPIGAVIIGHFGDRVGRKKMLVLLRVLQGLSAAGEQSGANSLTLEHAPEGRRGFFTSFTLSGTQAGLILATLVFIPVAALPEEQLYSWGWRIPFYLSALVVAVGYWVRRTLPETPEFERVEQSSGVAKLPVAVLLRDHWASVLRVIFCALVSVVSTIVATYSLAYATGDEVGLDKATFLWVVVVANVVALGALPLWAPRVRPHRPAAGVRVRRLRLRGADLPVPLGDLPGQLPADLPVRHPALGPGLLGRQRHLAVVLRRDVRHPGSLLRHGDRHADRVRARWLLPADRGGDRR